MENLPTRIKPPNQDSTQHDSYMATLTVGGAGLEPTAARTLSPHPIPLGHPTPLPPEEEEEGEDSDGEEGRPGTP